MSKMNIEFLKLFTVKIAFTTFYLHLLHLIQFNFFTGVFEISGYNAFYSLKSIFIFIPICGSFLLIGVDKFTN